MCKESSLPDTRPGQATAMTPHHPSYITVPHAHDRAAYIADLLESSRQQEKSFALIILTIQFAPRDGQRYAQYVEQSTCYYCNHLRPLIRKTDTLVRMQHTLCFVLPGADLQGGTIAQERLWEALLWQTHNTQELEIERPISMSIGVSTGMILHSGRSTANKSTLSDAILLASRPQHSFDQDFPDAEKDSEPTTEPLPSVSRKEIQTETADKKEEQNPYTQARRLGIPYLAILPRSIPEKLRQICSPRLALELHCYPIGKERNTLTVAIANPNDHHILARLQQETGLEIFPVIAPDHEIRMALEQLS